MFAQLNLHERLLRALEENAFVEPTPVQQEAIPVILAGRDLRATAQTGSGKTAAFLLPVLHQLLTMQEGGATPATRVLILVPTRELARQILEETERFARFTFLQSAMVIGGEGFKEQSALLRKVPDVLVATPGRLLEHIQAGSMPAGEVRWLILDEADRMLDMGFAEDMQAIISACGNRQQTLLFSATTGGRALREITQAVLRDPQHLMLNPVSQLSETTRQQVITAESAAHKEKLLAWLLANENYRKAMVFTNTRAMADQLYGRLRAQDYRVFVLHGEKDQQERKMALERFSQGGERVLIATDVAARGLDIEGVDLVINYDMPRSGDEYVHRIGRTGRSGEDGLAISLIEHLDWNLMSSIQRYLKQTFEKRVLPGLKGGYHGPKNVKSSGKAAGSKKKKAADKKSAKPVRKPSLRKKPLTGDDGHAPLRKKPARPAE
ncbi:DEAD/DEAH box helicase [Thiopseudomonas denitrificans]|uniref:Superfamily II DNA/RNA helicase n=1 Tax=Thiopseudomonas denitrificans TaxID=1501432 RepID=A0A4R6U3C2_9GAMM|nr:DEAD/DEAH box helicase [Thiopseudomonas denitrificans]TDQ40166.1 superfamily II DNA/RNA helicase [Thiopseudomonas denitrificans]